MLVTLENKSVSEGQTKKSTVANLINFERVAIRFNKKIIADIKSTILSKTKDMLTVLHIKEPNAFFLVSILENDTIEFDSYIKNLIAEREMRLQYVLTGDRRYYHNLSKVSNMTNMYEVKLQIDEVIDMWDTMCLSYADTSYLDRIIKNLQCIKKVYNKSNDNKLKHELETILKSFFEIVSIIIEYKKCQIFIIRKIIDDYNALVKKM